MTVVITVAKRDSSGNDVPLCTQKAIVPLPGEPVILYARHLEREGILRTIRDFLPYYNKM